MDPRARLVLEADDAVTRPAHGGYPGEVVVSLPPADRNGLVPLGFTWVAVEALAGAPEAWLAERTGASLDEVRQARGHAC